MATTAVKKGFTLVELLIAMTIMLVLLVLAGTAYQLYQQVWQRDLSKIDTTFSQFRHTELMLDAVQAILPVAVTDNGKSAFYFLGREEGFTAVTYSPIYQVGFPAVIRIFREETAQGKYQLVYEEASLQHVVLKDAAQNLPFSFRKIISTDLEALSFSYYGWPSLNSRMEAISDLRLNTDIKRQWFSGYDALERQMHPEKVKITLNDFALEFAIADRTRVNTLFTDGEAI